MNTGTGPLLVSAWHRQTDGDRAGVYDEILREVSARAVAEQSLGKADIGALVLWKRITAQATWATQLLLLPDADVRAATHSALLAANDMSLPIPEAGQTARSKIWNLPGMGGTGALSSAVLLALAPERMAVWDRRVATALDAIGRRPKPGAGFYGRYLSVVLDLAAQMDATSTEGPFSPRDVDLALFAMAASDQMLDDARSTAEASVS